MNALLTLTFHVFDQFQAMIRDLFHSPPIYKANIALSFKPRTEGANQPKPGEKRKPITFNSNKSGDGATGPKKRQLYMDVVGNKKGGTKARASVSNYRPTKSVRPSGHYAPPSGKFSSKIRRSSWNN